jgi:hypothetical protein
MKNKAESIDGMAGGSLPSPEVAKHGNLTDMYRTEVWWTLSADDIEEEEDAELFDKEGPPISSGNTWHDLDDK